MQPADLQKLFISNGLTLSLAESCTGGAIAARLVALSGCSAYFLGSIVSYSRTAKAGILGVDPEILTSYGEVSPQTAEAMSMGALQKFDSDIALAVTGIAGPDGGSPEKPVGTVFFAMARKNQAAFSWKSQFSGERESIISQSVAAALEALTNIFEYRSRYS